MRPGRPPRPAAPPGALITDASLRRFTPREAGRAVLIAAVVVRHIGPGLLRRRDRTAARLAPRVNDTVVALGPPFVKLSQVVASSPGLFPVEISDALRNLLDDAPAEPWPAMRTVVERDLGAPVGTRFESIDPVPLAAASIAQVHAATLSDGSRFVIKVRRTGIERRFLTDLRLLRLVARLLARYWRAARVLNPVAVVDGVVVALRTEIDFRLEADAMERFDANLRAFGSNDRIRVPAVRRDLSGAEVLTMERVDGIKVDDLVRLELTGFDLTALLRAGVRAWVEAAAEHGFFHGDVHAGNLMLDGDGRVVFLDFGIMGELDPETRRIVRRGVVALLHHRDFGEVTDCLVELGATLGHEIDRARAVASIQDLAAPLLDMPLSEIDYQEVFVTAVRRASPHGVQLPRSLVLLVKQIIYFERYAKLVAPGYDILSDPTLIDFMVQDAPSR